jgi:DNA replication protein DnaC
MKTFKFNREQAKEFLENTQDGVIITGPTGVGKTELLRKPRMVTASQLAMEFQARGIEPVKELINAQIQYQGMKVVIDELGNEKDGHNFGNELDPVAYVVQKIYDINQTAEQKIKLYFTTNLNKEELTQKYGIRVIERIWEMCNRIVLEDTDLRKQN